MPENTDREAKFAGCLESRIVRSSRISASIRVAAVAILVLGLAACESSAPPQGNPDTTTESPRVGFRAPNFRLNNLAGQEVSLASFAGKVVFINFWATWCGPCLSEMPSMEALYKDFRDLGFEILAVSSDFEGANIVQPYVDRLGLTYPILLDPSFFVHEKYLVRSVPTSVIVDRDGVITHKIIGSRDWNAPVARDLLERLLSKKET